VVLTSGEAVDSEGSLSFGKNEPRTENQSKFWILWGCNLVLKFKELGPHRFKKVRTLTPLEFFFFSPSLLNMNQSEKELQR
jgi:hypothetical protein